MPGWLDSRSSITSRTVAPVAETDSAPPVKVRSGVGIRTVIAMFLSLFVDAGFSKKPGKCVFSGRSEDTERTVSEELVGEPHGGIAVQRTWAKIAVFGQVMNRGGGPAEETVGARRDTGFPEPIRLAVEAPDFSRPRRVTHGEVDGKICHESPEEAHDWAHDSSFGAIGGRTRWQEIFKQAPIARASAMSDAQDRSVPTDPGSMNDGLFTKKRGIGSEKFCREIVGALHDEIGLSDKPGGSLGQEARFSSLHRRGPHFQERVPSRIQFVSADIPLGKQNLPR